MPVRLVNDLKELRVVDLPDVALAGQDQAGKARFCNFVVSRDQPRIMIPKKQALREEIL